MLCFRRDKASPLWTNHAGFNEFLAKFTDALIQFEPNALLEYCRPNTDLWCLARVFGPACIQSLIGLGDGSTFLREAQWLQEDTESLLIWTFSNGRHASLVVESGGDHGWWVQEILPFDPRAGEPDTVSREAYLQFLNLPPRQARTGNPNWDRNLQVILQTHPLKPSMPLYRHYSGTLPLARHTSEILTFFQALDDLGWQVDPWISIRECTYVFRVKNRDTGTLAAVKWLCNESPKFMKKFDDEINLLREVKNMPGTPTYLDHGVAQGRPYHLCSWENGHSLQLDPKYFKALPHERKIRIAVNTLRTIVGIHQAGILHRDIAPDHLLVSDKDDVTLLDFGMSSRMDTLSDAKFQRVMENEMSNLGFTLHTLLVGGIAFPFGDTQALKDIWPSAERSVQKAPIEEEWKRFILACVQLNPRIYPQNIMQISKKFSLLEFSMFRLASHFQT